MISSVEKIYSNDTGEFCNYKVTQTNGEVWLVRKNATSNRHYQAIQEWIAEGNTVIDNGGGE